MLDCPVAYHKTEGNFIKLSGVEDMVGGKALSSLALSGGSEKLDANDLLTGIQNVASDYLEL